MLRVLHSSQAEARETEESPLAVTGGTCAVTPSRTGARVLHRFGASWRSARDIRDLDGVLGEVKFVLDPATPGRTSSVQNTIPFGQTGFIVLYPYR